MVRRAVLAVIIIAGLAAAVHAAAPTALTLARQQSKQAAERAERFERQAEAATDEAARARAQAEALIARIQGIEADMSAAEARIRLIEALRARQRAELAERQQPLIRLTAALQSMAARPPALALVQPGTIDDMVRVRALLGATLPVIEARTAGLRAEVERGNRLGAEAGRAAASLAEGRQRLDRRRAELARAERSEHRRAEDLAASALLESDRSIAFEEDARDLAARMRSDAARERVAAELAALPGPVMRPGAAQAKTPGTAAPYRLPVEGRLVTGMGELSDAGVHARGLTFAPAAGSPVIAPRAGTVAYAGRFRSYGEIVIIDHGGGWTSTITGLAALRVRRGDAVAAGDPIGRSASELTVELRRHGRPHSITAFIAPSAR